MKRIISICALLLLCTFCFATDIEDVIAKAYQNSPQVEQYERSRQDSLFSNSVSDSSYNYSITIPESVVYDEDGTYVPTAKVAVQYNNSKANAGVKGTITSSRFKTNETDYPYNLVGQLTVFKTFEFKDWTTTDYARKIRDVNLEQSYAATVLNFRKSVLADVYSIVDAKHSLIESERKLAESQKDYNAKLATGELKEGTTAQIKAKMALDSTVSALDSQKKSLESKLASFEKNYGFAYTDVDSASRPVLEFVKNADGNSKVYVAKLELLSAQQALKDKTGKSSSITLSANVDPTVNFRIGSGYQDTGLSVGADIGLNSGNFSLGAGVVENYTKKDGWGTPALVVSGSYTDGNKNSKDINDLESAVLSKQLAYDNAVFTYNTSAKTVEDNIQKALVAYDQLEIRKDYNNRILDYTTTLYENGFTTAKALEDARFEVESDSVDELLLNLTALQLECEIKILAL